MSRLLIKRSCDDLIQPVDDEIQCKFNKLSKSNDTGLKDFIILRFNDQESQLQALKKMSLFDGSRFLGSFEGHFFIIYDITKYGRHAVKILFNFRFLGTISMLIQEHFGISFDFMREIHVFNSTLRLLNSSSSSSFTFIKSLYPQKLLAFTFLIITESDPKAITQALPHNLKTSKS